VKVEEKFVETKYGVINYLEIGEGKKNLLVIHGGLGTPEIINGQVDNLLSLDYKIIAIYQPGHGKSFKIPNDFSFDDLVDTIEDFVKRLNIKVTDVLGHSMGGGIAAAIANCSFVNKTILIDPALDGNLIVWYRVLPTAIHDAYKDKGLISSVFPKLENISLRVPPFGSALKIYRLARKFKIKHKILGKNTLVLWGQNDTVIPFESRKPVLDELGLTNIKLISGGHFWYKHQQKLLFSAIKEIV
jgi:pimeloyl-ACP methyl ester carboxylesterase